MDQLRRELNFKQLTKLLTFYKIPGRSEMTTKEDKAIALGIIPEVINNIQQIIDNRTEIFRTIDNMPRRRAESAATPSSNTTNKTKFTTSKYSSTNSNSGHTARFARKIYTNDPSWNTASKPT